MFVSHRRFEMIDETKLIVSLTIVCIAWTVSLRFTSFYSYLLSLRLKFYYPYMLKNYFTAEKQGFVNTSLLVKEKQQ